VQHEVIQTIAISAFLGTAGVLIGRWLKVPALLFFMVFGVLAGPTFLGLIETGALGNVLMPFIEVAVSIIIFEAGLALPISGFRKAPVAIRRMNTVALPLTGILAMLTGHFVAGLPWSSAALFGALIVVTGPTVIGPLLRSVALSPKVDNLLRWESVWADCFGVLLAGVVLEGVLHPSETGFALPGLFVLRLGVGIFVGVATGYGLARVLIPWTVRLGDPGLPGIVALTGAVGTFYISNLFAESSGVVASAVAGMMLARHPLKQLESIKRFKDQITSLIVAFLFVFLSAQLDLMNREAPWLSLVGASLILIFIIRPLVSWIALAGTTLKMNEKIYIGLIGPRGIIAAAVASYYGIVLSSPLHKTGDMLLLTFVTIFISAGFVSMFGRRLADWTRVALVEYRTGIIIIGYGPFSSALAKLLKHYVDVILVDSDPFKCSRARMENIESVCESGMADDLYEDLMERGFRRALILTPNMALNNLMAVKAKEHLGLNRVFTTAVGTEDEIDTLKAISGNSLAFSVQGVDIAQVNRFLEEGHASLEVMPADDIPKEVRVDVLACEVKDGGVRIKRADGEAKGKVICLIHKGEPGTGEPTSAKATTVASDDEIATG
jgi:NhaP-type Na+/H+ or K+/H+ antiporter